MTIEMYAFLLIWKMDTFIVMRMCLLEAGKLCFPNCYLQFLQKADCQNNNLLLPFFFMDLPDLN